MGHPKNLTIFFFYLGHYSHDDGGFFSYVSGSLCPIFLTISDPPPAANMTSLKLIPNTDYCSMDGFPQDIIACSRHVGGIHSLSVQLGLTGLDLVLR